MSEPPKLPNIVAAMKWLDAFDSCVYSGPEWAAEHARTIKAEIERLRSPVPAEDGEKLWLWRDGKDRFLAFRSLFPLMPDGGDPATIGQPSGYAFYHPMTLAAAQKVSREADRAEDSEGLREALNELPRYSVHVYHVGELESREIETVSLDAVRAALSSGYEGRKT